MGGEGGCTLGGGGQLRDPASIYMEKDTWHQARASVKHTWICPTHVSTHVQTHICIHTCLSHTRTRRGEGERSSLLTLWCFLGLDFNQTKSLLLLFLLSNSPALARHRKGSTPNQSDQKTNRVTKVSWARDRHSRMGVRSGCPRTWCWICPQEKWDSIKGVFQVPLSHPGLASGSRGSSYTAPVHLSARNQRKANKGSTPSRTFTFPENKSPLMSFHLQNKLPLSLILALF